MSDEVKGIFKVLLGTIAVIVFISVFTELFNISITGMQLRQMGRMAARQSIDLFTQETYKGNDDLTGNLADKQGMIAVPNIKDVYGNDYLTGNFYDINNAGATIVTYDMREEIWRSIYNSADFKNFCTGTGTMYGTTKLYNTSHQTVPEDLAGHGGMESEYENLKAVYLAANNGGTPFDLSSYHFGWDTDPNDAAYKEYMLHANANTYYENMYTAVNCGVPYLDQDIVNRMYQYHLALLLTNGDYDSIQTEMFLDPDFVANHNWGSVDPNRQFINYKGFKVYAQDARMSNYDYTVFDLHGATAGSALADKFEEYTNMKAKTSGMTGSIADGTATIGLVNSYSNTGIDQRDNEKITVVGVTFTVPCSYIGITPIRRVFQWIMNYSVGGYNQAGAPTQGIKNSDARQWNETITDLVSGGTFGGIDNTRNMSGGANNMGYLPNSGRLTYTLVR